MDEGLHIHSHHLLGEDQLQNDNEVLLVFRLHQEDTVGAHDHHPVPQPGGGDHRNIVRGDHIHLLRRLLRAVREEVHQNTLLRDRGHEAVPVRVSNQLHRAVRGICEDDRAHQNTVLHVGLLLRLQLLLHSAQPGRRKRHVHSRVDQPILPQLGQQVQGRAARLPLRRQVVYLREIMTQ